MTLSAPGARTGCARCRAWRLVSGSQCSCGHESCDGLSHLGSSSCVLVLRATVGHDARPVCHARDVADVSVVTGDHASRYPVSRLAAPALDPRRRARAELLCHVPDTPDAASTRSASTKTHWSAVGHVTSSQRPSGDQARSRNTPKPLNSVRPLSTYAVLCEPWTRATATWCEPGLNAAATSGHPSDGSSWSTSRPRSSYTRRW